jgi:5'-deoxynucleotidase YfbR-like HD superfamily hydrolase
MPKGFSLRGLLAGTPNRLRYAKRFSLALTLHKESVAEHSYYVGLYAYFIVNWVRSQGFCIDMEKVLERCLFHDLEEAVTGDSPRPHKHRRPQLLEMMNQAALEEFSTVVAEIIPENEETKEYLGQVWRDAKDESPEGRVVALADFLSVVSHLYQEVNGSNSSMYEHYESTMGYMDSFNDPSFDFLKPVVDEARVITTAIFERAKKGCIV